MPSIPSSTGEVIASRPVQVMLRALEAGRLSHSLIVSGEDQELVEQVGHHLAEKILTDGAAPTFSPLVRHPDFLTVRPAGKMRQISADTTRDLIRSIAHSPKLGSRKAAVLFEAERMNLPAANIFLKTLEEPPANTTIILLTSRPHFLLPTIRSRCLHFRLPVAAARESFTPALSSWLDEYGQWLEGFSADLGSKQEIGRQIVRLYGLLSRFSPLLKEAVGQAWKEQKENLPENLAEEEEEALAEGLKVEVRDQLFAAMEHRLRSFALGRLEQEARETASGAFIAAVNELERVSRLLRVNLNESTALEGFLLGTLRAWGRRQS